MSIVYWNREKQRTEEEKIFGEKFLRLAYQNTVGQIFTDTLFNRRWFSTLYGYYQNSARSAQDIPQFIQNYQINMAEYEESDYHSFNDFFIRRFRPGARPFANQPNQLAAFAEGRYFAFAEVTANHQLPIKGASLNLEMLLASKSWAEIFLNGPAFIARLCPVDYHRFHFPDNGRVVESKSVGGRLHSVNPVALAYRGDIPCTNERQIHLLETENFGRLAYIEIGALNVGKIVQSHPSPTFNRGEEKGYFLLGGSMIVLLGEAGRWRPDQDLLDQTSQGRETFIKLGDKIAERKR